MLSQLLVVGGSAYMHHAVRHAEFVRVLKSSIFAVFDLRLTRPQQQVACINFVMSLS